MRIVPIADVQLTSVPGPWPLTADMRAAAASHWQGVSGANPHLWDGRILGLSAPGGGVPDVEQGVLRAEAREDSYSTFLYWRDSGFPDIGICHVFGTALIVSADRALIYGVMGEHTANPGKVYPPGGSLEPRDRRADGSVDILGCIDLELAEETGLDPGAARLGGLVGILDQPRLSVARLFYFDEDAEALIARIRHNLTQQDDRELADVIAVRTGRDAEAARATDYAIAVAHAFERGEIG